MTWIFAIECNNIRSNIFGLSPAFVVGPIQRKGMARAWDLDVRVHDIPSF